MREDDALKRCSVIVFKHEKGPESIVICVLEEK